MTSFQDMMQQHFGVAPLPPLRTNARAYRHVRTIAASIGVDEEDIFSTCRFKEVAHARQLVYLALHTHLGWSYSRIGRFMNRNHASVISGIHQVSGQ